MGSSSSSLLLEQCLQDLPKRRVPPEDAEFWDDVFGCDLEEDKLEQAMYPQLLLEVWDSQPDNLYTLALKSLANVTKFMETEYEGPGVDVLTTSVRILLQLVAAPRVREEMEAWFWEAHPLLHFLSYVLTPKSNQPVGLAGGDVGSPEFPTCWATVMLQAATNLCFFPGHTVDPEVMEADEDHYAFIPSPNSCIRSAPYIWEGGVALPREAAIRAPYLVANRLECLKLLLSLISPCILGLGEGDLARRRNMRPPSACPWLQAAAGPYLQFGPELFYSLINTVLSHDSISWEVGSIFRFAGSGHDLEEGLVVSSIHLALILLQYGKPFHRVLVDCCSNDVETDESPHGYTMDGASSEAISLQLRISSHQDYNVCRRCLHYIGSEVTDELSMTARGLLRLLRAVHAGTMAARCHRSIIILLGYFVREVPGFREAVCASTSLVSGVVLFLVHHTCKSAQFLKKMLAGEPSSDDEDDRDGSTPAIQPELHIGMVQLCTLLLTQFSELSSFGKALRNTTWEEYESEIPIGPELAGGGASLLDVVTVALCKLLREDLISFAHPVLAKIFRDLGPSMVAGWKASAQITDTLEVLASAPGLAQGQSTPVAILSLFQEGIALALCSSPGNETLLTAMVSLVDTGLFDSISMVQVQDAPKGGSGLSSDQNDDSSPWLRLKINPGQLGGGWPMSEVIVRALNALLESLHDQLSTGVDEVMLKNAIASSSLLANVSDKVQALRMTGNLCGDGIASIDIVLEPWHSEYLAYVIHRESLRAYGWKPRRSAATTTKEAADVPQLKEESSLTLPGGNV